MASKVIGYIATGSSEDRWHVIASGVMGVFHMLLEQGLFEQHLCWTMGNLVLRLPGDVDAQRQRARFAVSEMIKAKIFEKVIPLIDSTDVKCATWV